MLTIRINKTCSVVVIKALSSFVCYGELKKKKNIFKAMIPFYMCSMLKSVLSKINI